MQRDDDDDDDDDSTTTTKIERRKSRFLTISSLRRELSTRTLKWSGRNRVEITCNIQSAHQSRATCRVPLGPKRQGWLSLNRIYFSFTLLAETINR